MRTREQLEQDRRTALAAWEQARTARAEVAEVPGAAREARQEAERHAATRAREDEAIALRTAAAVDQPLTSPRAVVVHRLQWTRTALRKGLEQSGVCVVAEAEDGATGLGTVVAEQPDLVLVQQQLPWLDGLRVVREVREFAPAARIAVHADTPDGERLARQAGADLVFPRSARPQDIVERLVALPVGKMSPSGSLDTTKVLTS